MSSCFSKRCICPKCGKVIDPYFNITRDGVKSCIGCEEMKKDGSRLG